MSQLEKYYPMYTQILAEHIPFIQANMKTDYYHDDAFITIHWRAKDQVLDLTAKNPTNGHREPITGMPMGKAH